MIERWEIEWLDRRHLIERENCDSYADAIRRVRDRYPAAKPVDHIEHGQTSLDTDDCETPDGTVVARLHRGRVTL